jgi:hypothetical protein
MTTNKFTKCVERCMKVSYSCVQQQRRQTNFKVSDDKKRGGGADFNREIFLIPGPKNIQK